MNKYKCSNSQWINGIINIEKEFDPKDYLMYPNEDDLIERISFELEIYGDNNLDVIDSENDIFIPDEFIKEWKKLKANESNL